MKSCHILEVVIFGTKNWLTTDSQTEKRKKAPMEAVTLPNKGGIGGGLQIGVLMPG